MSIGHNNPPDVPRALSVEEAVSVVCRAVEILALIGWGVYVLATATW